MGVASLARIWLTRSLQPFLFTKEYDEILSYHDIPSLGLYVHIPFCRSVCSFCPYCKEVYTQEKAEAYKEALLQEIRLVGKGEKRAATSLYFGGGTPALFADCMDEIISCMQEFFTIEDGIGCELHPDNVREDTLYKLQRSGVTKISIGIQSFQTHLADALGRKVCEPWKLKEELKGFSFETVSMDFIFGIPGQTLEDIKKDIQLAFANGANQIALYPFIDFTYTDNEIPPLGQKHKKNMLKAITDYCREKGYERNSIWTFGLPGTHKYSSMTRDHFLGFGCSAVTLLSDQFKLNTFSVNGYIHRIKDKKLPTSLTLRFSRRQRMLYYLFWTAYTMKIEEQEFERLFGVSLKSMYGMELWAAEKLGLLKKKNRVYYVTNKGAYYYHYFEQFYTLSYIDTMWNISGKTDFPDEIRL